MKTRKEYYEYIGKRLSTEKYFWIKYIALNLSIMVVGVSFIYFLGRIV